VEIDETALNGLIEQSRDTHADALRAAREPLADLVDLGRQTRTAPSPARTGGGWPRSPGGRAGCWRPPG
jgi:hypothetical protein